MDARLALRPDDEASYARVMRFSTRAHESNVVAFVDGGTVSALYLLLPPGPRLMIQLAMGQDLRFERTDIYGVAVFRHVLPGPMRLMYRLTAYASGLGVLTDVATEWTVLP
jgi:hypothetical protein